MVSAGAIAAAVAASRAAARRREESARRRRKEEEERRRKREKETRHKQEQQKKLKRDISFQFHQQHESGNVETSTSLSTVYEFTDVLRIERADLPLI